MPEESLVGSPCWQQDWPGKLLVSDSSQAEDLHQLLGRLIWVSASGLLLGTPKRPISMVITMVLRSLDDAVLLVECKIAT